MTPCDLNDDCLHVSCLECGVVLRTNAAHVDDHPGTRTGMIGQQHCMTCIKRRGKPIPRTVQITKAQHEVNKRGLERLMQARHKRLQKKVSA